MKIIFLENRHKTFFWKKIAQNLSNEHEIHWLVQNKNFLPPNEIAFILSNTLKIIFHII